MSIPNNIALLVEKISESMTNSKLIKLTLSNKRNKSDDLNNVFVKPVVIRDEMLLSFVYRHATRDVTKNLTLEETTEVLSSLLTEHFFNADLFTTEVDWLLLSNKRGNSKLLKKPASSTEIPLFSHDKIKRRLIQPEGNIYLRELGVLTADFKVKSDMQDKFKQINKYVEIIDGILKSVEKDDALSVVDMGSGKGYLTFALYDYLKSRQNGQIKVTGVEFRPDLVEKCNKIATDSGFDGLSFIKGTIEKAKLPGFDMLIALHACDTATDEAIFRGIKSKAPVIVCAPCCHKQIRKQLKPDNILKEITRHGILEERQAEMLTDTIRALILEAYGYKTRVFEFIATEHTPKNVLISGTSNNPTTKPNQAVLERVKLLKAQFGVEQHHLEKLLGI
ncbi:MAG: SAM-dependent methyltransferase [Bacteroidetes bacterium HGW-Bacteroidetes-9]|jgi:SAM-dependent methyltransferase|nr:MAG: SAM-dependent methyltransferase [Bacteroidetes bacterium HGW-Bacteroidetes-9]